MVTIYAFNWGSLWHLEKYEGNVYGVPSRSFLDRCVGIGGDEIKGFEFEQPHILLSSCSKFLLT
jgi:hypothetical protein